MKWLDKCESALIDSHIFLSHQHLSRFQEAFKLIKNQPFITKGLVKCLFLSAWDQEHFNIFMDVIYQLIHYNERNLDRMLEIGRGYAERSKASEKIFYTLAIEFLLHPDQTPSESFILKMSTSWIGIADSTLEASYIIDKL